MFCNQTKVVGSVTKEYAFNKNNEVIKSTSIVTQNGALATENDSCSYDANGNMISKTDKAGAITTYKYDAKNQLVYIQEPKRNVDVNGTGTKTRSNIVTEYVYDKAGNRTLRRRMRQRRKSIQWRKPKSCQDFRGLHRTLCLRGHKGYSGAGR